MANACPNRYNLIRALSRSAFRVAQAAQDPPVTGNSPIDDDATVTPTSVLEGIIAGKFNSELTDGKILIHSAEAGGVTQFAMLPDMSPAEIVAILEETITWVQSQPDPNNPSLYVPRLIKRLRASFAKSVI